MNANAFSQKDYENKPPSGPKKTNPIQTQSNPVLPVLRSFSEGGAQLALN